jgi:3-dehydroquinate synthase
MNIVLTGFMGTGKTTLGRLLAKKLSLTHVDTDELIEKSQGLSVSAIFNKYGENYFRQLEAEVIKKLAQENENLVISTGGKTLLNKRNLNLLTKKGIIITLMGEPELLWERVKNSFLRPLVNLSNKERFIDLYRKREPLYEQLPNKIKIDNLSIVEAIQKIMDILKAETRQLEVKLGERKSLIIFKRFLLSSPEKIVGPDSALKIFLVCDKKVYQINKPYLQRIFPLYYLVPGKDRSKNLRQAEKIWQWLIAHNVKRDSILISIGGGVIGDLCGFISSTILRGIKHYHIPSTLLAMIDSSLGGKNGLNFRSIKNAIGTFSPADKVFIDPLFLHSLDKKQLASGLVEAIKAGLIGDSKLFHLIEEKTEMIRRLDLETIDEVIYRAIQVKKEIVEKDPYETGLRKRLNLGHTLGHALESFYRFKIPHGEAVGIGLIYSLKISEKLGLCSPELRERVKSLLEKLELRTQIRADKKKLIDYMKMDKKITEKGLDFVLMSEAQGVIIKKNIPEEIMLEALKEFIIENIDN